MYAAAQRAAVVVAPLCCGSFDDFERVSDISLSVHIWQEYLFYLFDTVKLSCDFYFHLKKKKTEQLDFFLL